MYQLGINRCTAVGADSGSGSCNEDEQFLKEYVSLANEVRRTLFLLGMVALVGALDKLVCGAYIILFFHISYYYDLFGYYASSTIS